MFATESKEYTVFQNFDRSETIKNLTWVPWIIFQYSYKCLFTHRVILLYDDFVVDFLLIIFFTVIFFDSLYSNMYVMFDEFFLSHLKK